MISHQVDIENMKIDANPLSEAYRSKHLLPSEQWLLCATGLVSLPAASVRLLTVSIKADAPPPTILPLAAPVACPF